MLWLLFPGPYLPRTSIVFLASRSVQWRWWFKSKRGGGVGTFPFLRSLWVLQGVWLFHISFLVHLEHMTSRAGGSLVSTKATPFSAKKKSFKSFVLIFQVSRIKQLKMLGRTCVCIFFSLSGLFCTNKGMLSPGQEPPRHDYAANSID
jgi:hypothetical protein